jgi:hypothetical protein
MRVLDVSDIYVRLIAKNDSWSRSTQSCLKRSVILSLSRSSFIAKLLRNSKDVDQPACVTDKGCWCSNSQ